jgi:hypothetical protein
MILRIKGLNPATAGTRKRKKNKVGVVFTTIRNSEGQAPGLYF